MIVDSHQHVMLPTSMQIKKMDDAGVDKAILFTTTPHVERAATATLDAIGAEMQVLYQLLSGSYSPETRISKMKDTILELNQAIRTAPDRFYGFGPIPLGISEQATAEWVSQHIIGNSFKGIPGTQLINISSAGGYTIVPTAVTYCATKFYVSTFTEGLAWELIETGAKMRAKVLAPAATKTEFGKKANNVDAYDYDKAFGTYHTSRQMAEFLLKLYDSDSTLGIVDRETFQFKLQPPVFPYANSSTHNQNPN